MLYSLWICATNPIVLFTCITLVFVSNGFFKAFLFAFGTIMLFSTGVLHNELISSVPVVLLVTFVETLIAYFFKKNYFLLVD